MRKKILLIIVIIILVLIFAGNIYLGIRYSEKTNEAVDKAVEEFKFDYDEEVITYEIKTLRGNHYNRDNIKILRDYYIITIYGERTLVTYIYRDGEIWNYENKSC